VGVFQPGDKGAAASSSSAAAAAHRSPAQQRKAAGGGIPTSSAIAATYVTAASSPKSKIRALEDHVVRGVCVMCVLYVRVCCMYSHMHAHSLTHSLTHHIATPHHTTTGDTEEGSEAEG